MPRKSNEKRPVVAVVGRPPGLNIIFDDDDAADRLQVTIIVTWGNFFFFSKYAYK